MGVSTAINRKRAPKNRVFWEKWSKKQKPGAKVIYWDFWFMEWRRVTLKERCKTQHCDLGWYFKETDRYESHSMIRPSWIPIWILELIK